MITTFLTSATLDITKGAVAAYSLRKLKSSATKAIRVRRSNDNEEIDIGFIDNSIDVIALMQFVGINSGYITKWYDQSGYCNDAVQTTASNQPRIVNAGILEKDIEGNPAIYISTSDNHHLTVENNVSLNLTSNATFNFVHLPVSTGVGGYGRILEKPGAGYSIIKTSNNRFDINGKSTTTINIYDLNEVNVNSIVVDSNVKIYKYGIHADTIEKYGFASTSSTLYLFNRNTLDRSYDGKFLELIIFSDALTDIQRQKLEYNQCKYYDLIT